MINALAADFAGTHRKQKPRNPCQDSGFRLLLDYVGLCFGGEGGIRTHDPVCDRIPLFESGAFSRSATSPIPLYYLKPCLKTDKFDIPFDILCQRSYWQTVKLGMRNNIVPLNPIMLGKVAILNATLFFQEAFIFFCPTITKLC